MGRRAGGEDAARPATTPMVRFTACSAVPASCSRTPVPGQPRRRARAADRASGKILVGGSAAPTAFRVDSDFMVARYNPNGTLDRSFGTGGIATTPTGAAAPTTRFGRWLFRMTRASLSAASATSPPPVVTCASSATRSVTSRTERRRCPGHVAVGSQSVAHLRRFEVNHAIALLHTATARAVASPFPCARQRPGHSCRVQSGGAPRTDSVDVAPRMVGTRKEIRVVVRLVDAPLAVAHGRDAKRVGGRLSLGEQRDYVAQCATERRQDASGRVVGLRGRELGRLTKALKPWCSQLTRRRSRAIAALPGVLSVQPLHDYKLTLSQTVPYIGATAVQNAGVDGTGVRVAVLDTRNRLHPQVFPRRRNARRVYRRHTEPQRPTRGTRRLDGLFPTGRWSAASISSARVWPNGPLAPDPTRSIAARARSASPCAGGHGTHVADIIAGNDGASHRGVAPAHHLYAVKVCGACRPRAADWRCCKAWSSRWIRMATATFPMRLT